MNSTFEQASPLAGATAASTSHVISAAAAAPSSLRAGSLPPRAGVCESIVDSSLVPARRAGLFAPPRGLPAGDGPVQRGSL